MEEKQITPEEAFFSAKANLELAITAQTERICRQVLYVRNLQRLRRGTTVCI